jgi:hypothetical protein
MNPQRTVFPLGLALGIGAAGLLPLIAYPLWFASPAAALAPDKLPVCPLSLMEQWMAVLTAFAIKPTYMILSLGLILWLWRSTASDLTALRRGLVAFLAGEGACAVDYLFLGGRSELWGFFHSYGMAVAFSFVSYAGLEAMDHRLVKYSAPKDRCAALSLCRACIKYAEVPCGLRRLFTVSIPGLIVVACIPLTANLQRAGQASVVWGTTVDYSRTLPAQLFELRYCAWLALGLMLASWLVLLLKHNDPVGPSKALLAAGLGPLSFGTARLFLDSAYADQMMWSGAWEEITELLFVALVALTLWVFRHTLFRNNPAESGLPDPNPLRQT